MSALILKMQQCPKFETGIRNGDFYAIVAGLLLSFRQVRMFVNVEDTPSNVELQIFVFGALGNFLCGPLEVDGPFDQRLGRSAGLDPQLDKAFRLDSKVVEIIPFGDDTFADYQNPPVYFPEGTATAQAILGFRHRVQPSW
jgi:hypothetical protein